MMSTDSAGKGDTYRRVDARRYGSNYDRIFGTDDEDDSVQSRIQSFYDDYMTMVKKRVDLFVGEEDAG